MFAGVAGLAVFGAGMIDAMAIDEADAAGAAQWHVGPAAGGGVGAHRFRGKVDQMGRRKAAMGVMADGAGDTRLADMAVMLGKAAARKEHSTIVTAVA